MHSRSECHSWDDEVLAKHASGPFFPGHGQAREHTPDGMVVAGSISGSRAHTARTPASACRLDAAVESLLAAMR